MCKFCGDPNCKADEIFDRDPIEVLKEMFGEPKLTDEQKAKLDEIDRNTTILYDEALSDKRQFTSRIYRPEEEGSMKVYSATDTATGVFEEIKDSLNAAKVTGKVDDENLGQVDMFTNMIEMLQKMSGEPKMSFTINVSKLMVETKVSKDNEVLSEMKYPNIKSAEDVAKLVSFISPDFVDPILRDFDFIKEALEESTVE